MIADLKGLPGLAKWFLQSNLELKELESISDAVNPIVLLDSQKYLRDQVLKCIVEFRAKKDSQRTQYLIVSGEAGVGKSTLVKHVISELVKKGKFLEHEILLVSLQEHSSMDSLYALCSKIARKFSLRKDTAALERLEESYGRKDVALLNVLKNFSIILFDDIDADCYEIWQHVSSITKNHNQSLLLLGTCLHIRSDHKSLENLIEFHLKSLQDEEVNQLFSKLLWKEVLIPLPFFEIVNGIASKVKMISAVCNHHQSVSPVLDCLPNGDETNANTMFANIVASQLSCKDENLLEEICKMRRPLPVRNLHKFDKLINYGLAVVDSRGKQNFISVPSTVFKIHKNLAKCCHHQPVNTKQSSAIELWKEIMSPKLKEILAGCQTENWTFVPESWNNVRNVASTDMHNINDIINSTNIFDARLKEYDIVLECLYHALLDKDFHHAVALLFLVDRYTFWTGTCKAALSVLSYIEKECPNVPVPPQIVIRKARVLKNDGNIQEAMKVLDLVINSVESIGGYRYNCLDDSNHVTACCVSIKGEILRGLGLWKQAAQTLIKAIELTNNLERTEKKIISSSMAQLAETFRYMTIDDYQDIAEPLKLVQGHPLREAIRFATEAAKLCIFTPLFYLKNKRRAGDLSLVISKMLLDDECKYKYLENAAHEFCEGLRCHDSISRLESKDQFYEFILAVQRLSLICKERVVMQNIGENIAKTLEKLARLLYEHHCLFPQQIRHTEYSVLLVNLALSLVNLPEIPMRDNLEMLDLHVPVVQVKPSSVVTSLSKIKDERVQEITDIINISSSEAKSQPTDGNYPSVGLRNEETVSGSKDDFFDKFRNGVTVGDWQSSDDSIEKALFRYGEREALEAASMAAIKHGTTESTSFEDTSVRNKTTIQSLESETQSDQSYKEVWKERQKSFRSLATVQTTVEECYSTAEDESVVERNIRVENTINSLEVSDKLAVNWHTVESLCTGIKLPSDIHRAMQFVYDVRTNQWSESETLAYVGGKLQLGKKEGACRDAFNFEFLEQDDPLRKYIGKQYKLEKYRGNPRLKKQYQQDILCQSLSRYHATLFNKALYENPQGRTIGQVQFLPAILIEILDIDNEAERYYNVEPFIAGEFVKISNNFAWTVQGDVPGKDLLIAFSHFSFCASEGKLIIVDIQGWTSKEKGGQTYLTDPQIHTMDKKGYGTANRGKDGFVKFWTEQHPSCNDICVMLGLDAKRPRIEIFK